MTLLHSFLSIYSILAKMFYFYFLCLHVSKAFVFINFFSIYHLFNLNNVIYLPVIIWLHADLCVVCFLHFPRDPGPVSGAAEMSGSADGHEGPAAAGPAGFL